MYNIKNKIKNKNISDSKVLTAIERNNELNKIKRYKKGAEVYYKDGKYNIHSWYDLKEKGIVYELIDVETIKRIGKSNKDIQDYLFGVNQTELISNELEERLGYDVKNVDLTQNYYDIRSENTLNAKSEDEYLNKEKKLKSYEFQKKDYSIKFFYDISGYEYWKEHDFDNIIQINLEIKNYQFDYADLTTDLREILNKIDMIDYS